MHSADRDLNEAHPNWRENVEAWVRSMDPDATIEVRVFEDGTYAALKRLLFHYTVIHGRIGDNLGFDDRWCYATLGRGLKGLHDWNYPDELEPQGWHRNPRTGRRRPEGDASREYIDP
jgi:hypothetical protein